MTGEVGDGEDDASIELVPSRSDKYPRIDDILLAKSFFFQASEELSRVPGVPEFELSNSLLGYFSLQEIVEFCLVFVSENLFVIELGGDTVHVVDIARFLSSLLVIIGLEFYACLFCKGMERFPELHFLHLHEESDGSAPMMTRETIGDIFHRGDHKRSGFFAMKRAECLIIDPCFFHLYVASDEIDDVDLGFYFL